MLAGITPGLDCRTEFCSVVETGLGVGDAMGGVGPGSLAGVLCGVDGLPTERECAVVVADLAGLVGPVECVGGVVKCVVECLSVVAGGLSLCRRGCGSTACGV